MKYSEKNFNDYNGYDGIDANLETALYEYGLIWKKRADSKDFHFVYGVGLKENDGEFEYNLFDWADFSENIDFESEFDWVEWDKVSDCCGYNILQAYKEDKTRLPMIVYDLVSYYGYENIFGASYYPFKIVA